MDGLKKYSDYPIVQKILRESLDNDINEDKSSDIGQPSSMPDLKTNYSTTSQEDETV